MAVEVGSILEGKVTGVKKFGAFVLLPGGKTGMVHISEVSQSYVNDIHDFQHHRNSNGFRLFRQSLFDVYRNSRRAGGTFP